VKAMILAAGEGRRMRPLTDHTPKPLLKVAGRTLLEHHIINLRDAGITDLVVNGAYLGEQVKRFCGDGSRWGVNIAFSMESKPLETAGGIINALPLLGDAPFLVVNGDVYCPYRFGELASTSLPEGCAHIVLVPNPAHNSEGDFSLLDRKVTHRSDKAWTFSGLGLYTPKFFADCAPGTRPLKPLLDAAIDEDRLSGQVWKGLWTDVGTPERLTLLDRELSNAF